MARPLAVHTPDGRLVSNPVAALPAATTLAIRNATELAVSGLGIEELAGFEPFVNLSVLWVNDNALRAITGLDANFRLKALHAHNNAITSLAGGSLPYLSFLEELNLANNSLVHLDRCLATLSGLAGLRQLWLHHNPAAQEPGYRARVIAALPALVMLDNHVVTPAERRAADGATLAAAGRRGAAARTHTAGAGAGGAAGAGATAGTATKHPGGAPGERSVTHKWLAADVARIREARKVAERAALTGAFTAVVDPEWAAATLPAADAPPLPSALMHTVAGLRVDDAVDRAIIAEMAHRGVPAALPQPALLPPSPGRTGHLLASTSSSLSPQRRLGATATSIPPPFTTDGPLRMVLSQSLLRATPSAAAPPVSSDGGDAVLGHWERYRIRQVFGALCRPGDDTLSREQLLTALESCRDVGLRALPPAGGTVARGSSSSSSGSGGGDDGALAGYVTDVADAMTAPGSTERIKWLDFVLATETGVYTKGVPPPAPPAGAASAASLPDAKPGAGGKPPVPAAAAAPAAAPGARSRPASALEPPAVGAAGGGAAAAAAAKPKAPTVVRVATLGWAPLSAREARTRAERHAATAAALLDRVAHLIPGDPEAGQLNAMAMAAADTATFLTHVADSLAGDLDPESPPPPVPRSRVDYYATTTLRSAPPPRGTSAAAARTAAPSLLTTTTLRVTTEPHARTIRTLARR